MFDLVLKRQPVALDQFVKCGFLGFVALVAVGFGIGDRHRQAVCLPMPWPFRIALLMSELKQWPGIPLRLRDSAQHVQIGGPFDRWPNPCLGRLAGRD